MKRTSRLGNHQYRPCPHDHSWASGAVEWRYSRVKGVSDRGVIAVGCGGGSEASSARLGGRQARARLAGDGTVCVHAYIRSHGQLQPRAASSGEGRRTSCSEHKVTSTAWPRLFGCPSVSLSGSRLGACNRNTVGHLRSDRVQAISRASASYRQASESASLLPMELDAGHMVSVSHSSLAANTTPRQHISHISTDLSSAPPGPPRPGFTLLLRIMSLFLTRPKVS